MITRWRTRLYAARSVDQQQGSPEIAMSQPQSPCAKLHDAEYLELCWAIADAAHDTEFIQELEAKAQRRRELFGARSADEFCVDLHCAGWEPMRAYASTDWPVLLDAALRRNEQFAAQISLADTKAGLIAAAGAAVLSGTVANQEALRATLAGPDWVAVLLLGATLGGLVAVAVWLTSAVRPRLHPLTTPSVFAFPHVAAGYDPAHLDVQTLARQAWEPGKVLARIATVKFVAVRRALLALAVTAPLFVAWNMVAAAA